tara:strand:+ start:1631 stop:2488 length:858 start_codon:yes stop_codon:yes gene_type:complete
MKKFIIQILLFLFVLLVFNGIFKLILNDIYFDDYQQVNLNSQTYLLADSHGEALGQFSEHAFFNFSAPSDSYVDMKYKLEYLISKSDIKTLILTVDNHALSPYRDNSNNIDRSSYFTFRDDYSNFLEYLEQKYFYQIFVMFDSKYGTLLKKYLISTIVPDGFSQQNIWGEETDRYRKDASFKRSEMQFSFNYQSTKLKKELVEIIYLCKANNIKLIGIKFPLSKDYLNVPEMKNYGSDKIFQENGLEIMNFEEYFINNNFFKDQDHLNKKGAILFKNNLIQILSR